MSRIHFREGTDDWWFDPETGEYHYEGDSPLVRVVLSNMMQYTDVYTEPIHGIDKHPGEEKIPLSPEERREKIVKYLTQLNGIKLNHERERTSSN